MSQTLPSSAFRYSIRFLSSDEVFRSASVENVGTITKTWLYPHQISGWSLVSLGKLGSWFLLLFVSYAMVALMNRPKTMTRASAQDAMGGLEHGEHVAADVNESVDARVP